MNNTPSVLDKGVYTATLTPVHKNLSINHRLLIDHCLRLIESGSHGIALMGTTGEANSFSIREREEALNNLLDAGVPAKKLLVGTGLCALPDAVRLTSHACAHKVGGVLVLPPFYYKQVSDDGLYDFFDRLIDGVASDDLKIYLYHFPKMSGLGFSEDLIDRLLNSYPSVIAGMKDSSGNLDNMVSVQKRFPQMDVFAGTEKLLLPILQEGGAGCISATANVNIVLARAVYDAFINGADATSLNVKMTSVREAFEGLPFTGALKMFLTTRDRNDDWQWLRPPNRGISMQEVGLLQKKLTGLL